MEKALLPHLLSSIFVQVENDFKQNEAITDSILSTLHSVFDKVLKSALELIETNSITMLQVKDNGLKTSQHVFQVAGSSKAFYIIFPHVNYCQCKFYEQRVLHCKTYVTCKHYLAATLAFTWNKFRTFDIDFDVYKDIILNLNRPAEIK